MPGEWNRSGLPPHGMLLKETFAYFPRALISGDVWKLLVAPEHEDGCPLTVAGEFVNFEADEGILSHPFDLSTEGSVAIVRVPKILTKSFPEILTTCR
jgi:hypothetical protein